MHDDDHDHNDRPSEEPSLADAVRGRRFELADALGRAAGSSLKGASPVARRDQALLELRALLESRLPDAEGSLTRTILARLQDDAPLLAQHYDDPAAALAAWLDRVLGSPEALAALVRDADARWGRDYGERPRFEDAGPAPDDPYTEAGVRDLLAGLRRTL